MGAVVPIHPTTEPIPIGDVEIRWTKTHTWPDVVPMLRLGGSRALASRIRGLYELLCDRDDLDHDKLIFLREWLHDLANALYEGDESEPCPCSAVVGRRHAAEKQDA